MTERDPRAGGPGAPEPPVGRDAAPPDGADTVRHEPPGGPSAGSADAPTVVWTPPAGDPAAGGAPPPAAAGAPPPAPGDAGGDAQPPATPVRRQGAGRARWGIALLVTALIAAVGIGAFLLVSSQRPTSALVGYAPSDSLMYGELRLDLPGDQRQRLGEFLSKFPGFRDQSTLDVKLDDVLDRTVGALTDGEQTWTTDIEPWFGGQLGFTVGQPPTSPDTGGSAPEVGRLLLVATVKDVAAARAWVEDALAEAGGPVTTETHNGVELLTSGDGESRGAVAFHADKVMLAGDVESVRAAIDTGGSGGFGETERFRAASATLEGDSLGYAYIDMTRYLEWTEAMSEEVGMPVMLPGLTADLTPDWVIMRLRAQGNALAIEATAPHAVVGPDENRAGALAQHLPPGTILLTDAHEYGATILEIVRRLREDPSTAAALEEIDQYLAVLGGEDGLVGWINDFGIAVARTEDGLHGGLVVTPTDRAKAERLLGTLRSFAQLGGGSAGVTVREEDHNGTPITIIDAGDFADLAGMAGGGALPPGLELPEGRVELAWATTDEVVVIGVGSSFVRAVLDAGPGPSLAEDARYRALVEQVGAENLGTAWIDVTGIRELIETLGSTEPDAFAEYEQDIKPYLVPLDAAVSANVRDGDVDRTTFIVTVK